MQVRAAAIGATNVPLSKRLRGETRIAHRLVESTRLARAFFRGTLTAKTYAEGLARLYPVYRTMEGALDRVTAGDRLKAFRLPRVFRSAAILADLRYLGVSPDPSRAGTSARYAERPTSFIVGASGSSTPEGIARCSARACR